jgi:hypothetical protein
MFNNRGVKPGIGDVFVAIVNNSFSDNQTTTFMGTLSNTHPAFYEIFKKPLDQRLFTALTALYQAVIDDDQDKVKTVLDLHPKLLLHPIPQDFTIESKLTWQKFYVEDALMMAVKRK